MTLSLALIGCGGMGRRHIGGMRQLKRVGKLPFELAAVCDLYAAAPKAPRIWPLKRWANGRRSAPI